MLHQNLISFCGRKIDFTNRERVIKCVLVSVKLVTISHNIFINEKIKQELNLAIEIHNVRKF